MNELSFIITKDEKSKLDELIKSNPNVIIQMSARVGGFKIKLSALGGKQKELLELVNLLESSGFVL